MADLITLDIETAPHKSYHWRNWQENIAPGQMIEPTYMLSYVVKVNGRKAVYKMHEDPDFLSYLHDILQSADAIITYNGDKFDMLHVNREFIENGYPPLRPVPSIDLIKTVKGRFKFPSNRLDYVAGVLLGERKLETGGFDLWPAFINGDLKARRLMERYNKRDVNITWKLYKHLLPWIINHPYIAGDHDVDDKGQMYECPCCGTKTAAEYKLNATRRTRCFVVRQVSCRSCWHWYDGKRSKI